MFGWIYELLFAEYMMTDQSTSYKHQVNSKNISWIILRICEMRNISQIHEIGGKKVIKGRHPWWDFFKSIATCGVSRFLNFAHGKILRGKHIKKSLMKKKAELQPFHFQYGTLVFTERENDGTNKNKEEERRRTKKYLELRYKTKRRWGGRNEMKKDRIRMEAKGYWVLQTQCG